MVFLDQPKERISMDHTQNKKMLFAEITKAGHTNCQQFFGATTWVTLEHHEQSEWCNYAAEGSGIWGACCECRTIPGHPGFPGRVATLIMYWFFPTTFTTFYYFYIFAHMYYFVNYAKYTRLSYTEEVAHNERRQKYFTHFSLIPLNFLICH